jgi:CC2D2A N-terminal C2 domain
LREAATEEQYMMLRPSDISSIEKYDGKPLPVAEV